MAGLWRGCGPDPDPALTRRSSLLSSSARRRRVRRLLQKRKLPPPRAVWLLLWLRLVRAREEGAALL